MTQRDKFKREAWPDCSHLECSADCDPDNAYCDRLVEAFNEIKRLREAIEDAVDTLEAVDLYVDNPLYDRLRAIVDEQSHAPAAEK